MINSLRGIDVEVVLIGDITCGKPFGFYPTDNCGRTYYTIQFQGVNDKGFGDYADGFVPQNANFQFGARTLGCQVADQLVAPLGTTGDPLTAAALQYRADGTCPAPSSAGVASQEQPYRSSEGVEPSGPAIRLEQPDVMDVNRDLSMPGEYRGRTD